MQRRLWRLAGEALDDSPIASAPRLYVESLNSMFDAQSTRVAARNNRVPSAVLTLEVVAAAVALGLLGVYLSILGRGWSRYSSPHSSSPHSSLSPSISTDPLAA